MVKVVEVIMKRCIICILLLALTLNLCSCWDMREINEIGIVIAIGIDKKEDSNLYQVTAQIANIEANQSNKKEPQTSGQTFIANSSGRTIFEAIRNMVTYSSRRIIWSHNSIIIMGEQVARDDITPVMDFFTHNPELRMKTWITVSEGKASDYIATQTGLEAISGTSIKQLFRYHSLVGVTINSDMLNVYSYFLSTTKQPLIAKVSLKKTSLSADDKGKIQKKPQVVLAGAAVIKDTKMVGWLTLDETRGAAWIRDETEGVIVTIPHPDNPKKMISLEMKRTKVDIKSEIKDSFPVINIYISYKAMIDEEDTFTTLSIDEFKKKVELSSKNEILKNINKAIFKVQKVYKSDVFGFGRVVHVYNKEKWNNEYKDNWESIYPNVPVNIIINSDVNSSNLNQLPNVNFKKGGSK